MLVENIAKLGSSTRNATSAALILIAALAMYKWMVTPQAAYLSAAKGYESVMDKVVKQNKSIARQLEIKKKELQVLRESSAQIQSILFTPQKASEFLSDLQVISEQEGCIVNSINLIPNKQSPEKKNLGIMTKSTALSVIGVYRDIVKLLQRLQARTEKVWIDKIELQPLDPGSDKALCNLTISICQIINGDNS
jgi:Tfp pilus assembly protein PilO